MFKSKLLLLTVIASVITISCTKESQLTNKVTPSPTEVRVKTKSSGNKTETYFYDSQKRLSKIIFSENGSSYYFEYSYNNGLVLEYRSNEPRYEEEQVLPNGAVRINCASNPRKISIDAGGYFKGNSSSCETKAFEYDKNGFITKQELFITDYSRTDIIANDGKNIRSISSTGFNYGGGYFAYNTTFEYTDIKSTISNINFGRPFLGKSSEFLEKSKTENGNTTTYFYELDAQQRVINKTEINNKEEIVTTYTYY